MSIDRWNPWKLTAIGMALVIVTGLVTGLVVANWTGREDAKPASATAGGPVRHASATPTASDVEACNQHAKTQVGDKTTKVITDALIGGVVGAGVGAAGGAIAGGGKGAGKGAAIGGVVGATAGTLYGLNDAKKNDPAYVDAYRACMNRRGYTS